MRNDEEIIVALAKLNGDSYTSTKIDFEAGKVFGGVVKIVLISLLILFLGLKLFKVITWSWWIVFSPVLLYIIIMIIMIIGLSMCFIGLKIRRKRVNYE